MNPPLSPVTNIPTSVTASQLSSAFLLLNPEAIATTKSVYNSRNSVNTRDFVHALLTVAEGSESLTAEIWGRMLAVCEALEPFNSRTAPIAIANILRTHLHPGEVLENVIREWAKDYFDFLILAVRHCTKTPTALAVESARRKQETLRRYVIDRDGYVCPITGVWNSDCPVSERPADSMTASLHVAHIIPFNLNKKSIVLKMIERFTGGRIPVGDLAGNAINGMGNILMMEMNAHDSFDSFEWGIETFEEDDGNTIYRFKKISPAARRNFVIGKIPDGTIVSFGNGNNQGEHPLPDPGLLRLHLAICRVMHMCGMAEVIRDIRRRDSEFKEYASWLDGTEDTLDYLRSQLAVLEEDVDDTDSGYEYHSDSVADEESGQCSRAIMGTPNCQRNKVC
ncbi:hypothetical protein K440DRAFT_665351 [Wilcoxina mikolae CBS 423.85]|nr:hypothetical protein K440DRAFT_665351 [Wilcoxina mikolae CBS 423.85]